MKPETKLSLSARIASLLSSLRRTLSSLLISLSARISSLFQNLRSRYDQYKAKAADRKETTTTGDQNAKKKTVPNSLQAHRKPSLPVRTVRFLLRRRKLGAGTTWAERTTVFLTFGILVAATVQAYIYWQQWQVMQAQVEQTERSVILGTGQLAVANRNAKIAEDSLAKVQRAFVFVGDLKPTMVVGQLVDFSLLVENSGTTPTRDMVLHFSEKITDDPLPEDFNFPDLYLLAVGARQTPEHIYLGPRAKTEIHINRRFDRAEMEDVELGIKHLYIWGWIAYYDVFQRTNQHITKFCIEIVPVGPPRQLCATCTTWTMFQSTIRFWHHHNCYDDECNEPKRQ